MEQERKIGDIIFRPSSSSEWVDLKEPLELAQYTINSAQFNEKWITALTNIDESLEEFKTKTADNEINENFLIEKYFIYITHLSFLVIFSKEKPNVLSENIFNEFKRENENGTLCAYANVLLYLLLERLGLNLNLSYIQGLYRIKFPNGTFQRSIMGEYGAGLHAYLLLNDTIIDPTIQQIGDNYSLGESEFIIVGENLPANISLFGWREPREVVIQYAEKYAELRSLSIDEWLVSHENEANSLMRERIREGEVKFKRNEPCFCGSGKKYKKCCYNK